MKTQDEVESIADGLVEATENFMEGIGWNAVALNIARMSEGQITIAMSISAVKRNAENDKTDKH